MATMSLAPFNVNATALRELWDSLPTLHCRNEMEQGHFDNLPDEWVDVYDRVRDLAGRALCRRRIQIRFDEYEEFFKVGILCREHLRSIFVIYTKPIELVCHERISCNHIHER